MPTTASLASSGIVTIPGMMAGQVIAGGDPLNAAKYQFVVFGAIAALTLLADGLIMAMVYRTCFTTDDQYQTQSTIASVSISGQASGDGDRRAFRNLVVEPFGIGHSESHATM